MITVTNLNDVAILHLDVVRMTPVRAAVARDFSKTHLGSTCKAFVYDNPAGDIDRIELWAGDAIQRDAFVQRLNHELFN